MCPKKEAGKSGSGGKSDKGGKATSNSGASGNRGPAMIYFEPSLKCCTYHPTLPNFLVGAILSDERPESAEGKRRVRERIASRIGITPQWLGAPRKQRVLLEAARGTAFGRSKILLCPFFVQNDEATGEPAGLCSIWQHRESVCSTFFCKHERGAVGDAFWMSTKNLLGHIELTLARHAALHVSPDVTEPRIPRLKLTVEDLDDMPPNEDDYAGYWGEWAGREEELYVKAYEYVKTLTPDDLVRLFEDDPTKEGALTHLLDDMRHRMEVMDSRVIAERLIPNPAMRVSKGMHAKPEDGVAVITYSAFNAQHLSTDLYEVVQQFKPEETVAETRARLQKDHDVDIADEMLLSLQQYEILVPPKAAP
jgi:hypothetical protein